jgi:hypothetical protein
VVGKIGMFIERTVSGVIVIIAFLFVVARIIEQFTQMSHCAAGKFENNFVLIMRLMGARNVDSFEAARMPITSQAAGGEFRAQNETIIIHLLEIIADLLSVGASEPLSLESELTSTQAGLMMNFLTSVSIFLKA